MVQELSSVATFLGPKSMGGGILGGRSVWSPAYGFSPEGHVRRLPAWNISLWGMDKREISKELEFLGKITGSLCVLRWIHLYPKSWLFSKNFCISEGPGVQWEAGGQEREGGWSGSLRVWS